ncbi:MAG TPA: glycosyltransferase [Thermoleophilaceae bacterium]|nr:glycosyltransferase [Thermoleophilaceae bacterium]
MRGEAPVVSVVVPARNAEGTLGRALESLAAQTLGSFEAIVVENGSSDATLAVASSFAARDRRVRVETTVARGVSEARNFGLGLARGEWLLFLDADDTLDPRALELLRETAQEVDAAVSGWARVASDGTRFDSHVWKEADRAFESLAVTCAFAIHCCLVRRQLVVAVDGFDESLSTCEDWDLWLRLARVGVRFRAVDQVLALYHAHPQTASLDGRRMLADGLEVIGRAHTPDSPLDRSRLVPTRLACACFAAGLELGAGRDASGLLELLGDDRDPSFDPAAVAWCVYAAATLPSCRSPREWDRVWPLVEPRVDRFLSAIEERTAPGLARRARRELETVVLRESGAALTIGSRRSLRVELSRPIEDLEATGVERVVIRAELDGSLLGQIELPVCDGFVPASVLADALAAEFFWPLLGRYFELPEEEHAEAGWERFLRELWGERGEPRRVDGDRVDVECSEPLPDLEVGSRTLRVRATVGGAFVGLVELDAPRGRRLPADELREAISTQCGLELAVTAVREALLGRPLPVGVPLRDLLRAARAVRPRTELSESALVLPRWPGPVRGPASRRAALPVAAARELVAAGPPGLVFDDPPSRVLYEPGVNLTEPRRRFARRRRNGHSPHVESSEATSRLPILMYHRIASDGPEELRRYRLDAADFERQLDHLRRGGYRGVTLEEWRVACERRRPLPGRAVMLTFDDGYSDFASSAWPLLKRYGFPGTVFLVAGEMGGSSTWDRDLGETAPLMSWREARRLQSRGVQFGSHTVTHPMLTSLSNADVVREAARSRMLIAEQLGSPPAAIAYPYGDSDGAIAHLMGACGYTFGLTADAGHAELERSLLLMPRIEVRGDQPFEEFVAKLKDVTIAA